MKVQLCDTWCRGASVVSDLLNHQLSKALEYTKKISWDFEINNKTR